MRRKISLLAVVITASLFLQGCAVFMAANQPGKKDVNMFREGVPRSALIAEFGAPVSSEKKNGVRHDIFSFVQGYTTPVKIGRALFHGAADVFTFGLWEILGTPAEATFDGKEMIYKVSYDEDDNVKSVALLKKE